jgi:prolipoprotein diacylglyceryl transferase
MSAFIPSPAQGILHLGPVQLHAYGLMLAIGVLVAAKIASVRWRQSGHNPKEIAEIAVPVVIAGVVGARIYHLFTGYDWHQDGIVGSVEIWHGGLSIWGAVAGGLLMVLYLAHRRHLDTLALLDAIGPAVVVAQAIGRWGNYFNQELFGRPTRLPWAVEIDAAHRATSLPLKYQDFTTFHPTFLYESLWCLLVFGTIVLLERTRGLRKGQAFALYVAMYTFGRIFFEWLRVDPASKLFGVRFNLLLSAMLCVVAGVWFVRLGRREAIAVTPGRDNERDARHTDSSDEPRTTPTPDQEYSG